MDEPRINWRLRQRIARILLACWAAQHYTAFAGTQLPVPCAAGACGPGVNSFVTSGTATATQAGKTLSILQKTNSATLNWSSFNVGADGKVVFHQPSASAIALNRIYDANPSSIFGSLSANGQVYLLNANGFLFGAHSTLNVSGLIASSLNISDKTFSSGILSPLQNGKPALEPFLDANGQPILNTGIIDVQAGAQLTASGGRLLLAAPTVQNAGTLNAPDGQIVLAAGQKVYLQASDQPDLRGLIVEVDGGGPVSNQLSGVLSAPRGNITMTGLMVNQDGRISATTSVAANGSVVLQAADTVNISGSGSISAKHGGQLELGADSITEILPEYADTATAVDAQDQLKSKIALSGEQIFIHGATIHAPSATLTAAAAGNPSAGVQSGGDANARIRIDAGTKIDLSGSNAELPMSANLVSVQLRSNEFKDDPTQRNGALRGQTVFVDVRADGGKGTPIADVASAIAAVGRNIAQRTEAGGTASFLSEGDVVFNPGASINVSGGATTYDGGTIQTSQLVGANGKLYDIGSADPLQKYTGVLNPTFTEAYDKFGFKDVVPTPGTSHYEATYQQGAAAGKVQFGAPSLVIDGDLRANVTNGAYQRGAPGTGFGAAAAGGTFIVGQPGGVTVTTSGQVDYLAPAVAVTRNPTPVVVNDDAALPPQTLQLPASILTDDGFTNTQIYSNTTFSLPTGLPLSLPAASSLAVTASRIDLDSSITDIAGSLIFKSALTTADQNPAQPTLGPGFSRLGIGVGDGVTFDVSGQWTNNGVIAGSTPLGPTLQDAGKIQLQLTQPGNELVLGNDVTLRADGGAWLKSDGTYANGKGGSIVLDASPAYSAVQFGQAVSLQAFGVGTAAGGSFALTAPRIEVSQGSGGGWTAAQRVDDLDGKGDALKIYAPLYSDFGFSSVALTATGAAIPAAGTDDVLTVLAGTTLTPRTLSWRLNSDAAFQGGGGTVAGFSQALSLLDYQRPAASVSFSVLRQDDDLPLARTAYGALDVQKGASILADPGASISLIGQGSVLMDGTLRAQGGNVTVQIASPNLFGKDNVFDPGYVPDLGIKIGSDSVIDVSGGDAVLTPNTQGLLLGSLGAGGTVNIAATRGSLAVEPGSSIDVSGSSATLDVPNPGQSGAGYTREVVASPGGTVKLGSVESMQIQGTLNARAGSGSGGAAAAGSIVIDFTRSEVIPNQPDSFYPAMQINLVGSTDGAAPAPNVNLATIGLAQIQSSGADSLTLNAGGATAGNILIATSNPLTLGREVILNSRSVTVQDGVSASISAPYVQLGNAEIQGTASTAPTPAPGTGTLQVDAQQMTLLGNVALQGVSAATLTSRGDLQLQGVAVQDGPEIGSLLTTGNLTLNAARVFPDTFTHFAIQSLGDGHGGGGAVKIGQTAGSTGAPLSAGGALGISADDLEIDGSVYAPFGQIDLEASRSLTLGNGSLVSVSGAGLSIPYGQTQLNGGQWIYQKSTGAFTTIDAVPTKDVTLNAPNIAVNPSATIDLRGGGDLYAYEWVPGTGGSRDNLASAGAYRVSGLYAILPSQVNQAAPFDPQESESLGSRQSVYLSGGAGLPAGTYALLPPRYALQPGAMLIQVETSYSSASAGQIGALGDGTPVIAGYLTSGTTGLHTGLTEYQGFAIYPGSYAQQLSAYKISNASTFFPALAAQAGADKVPQPADAGALTFSVANGQTNSFDLQGSVLTAAAAGGRGALINISAPDLEVTTGGAGASGAIAISGPVLQSWNASALALGGASAAGSGSVAVEANTVTIDQGVQLTADQILLVAQQAIDLKTGAVLSSTAGKNGTALSTLPVANTVSLVDAGSGNALPQAGLLAVSDLSLPIVTRSGNATGGATITLEPGSQLNSGGALAIDSPGPVTLAGSIGGKGASWSLGSSSIAFGDAANSNDSLVIGSGVLADLQQAGAVRISSRGSIDIFTPLSLGATSAGTAPTLNSLTLLGAQIDNQSGGDSIFGGSTVTLGGVSGAAATPSSGQGSLTFVADTLNVGSGTLAISGFASTLAQVSGAIGSQQADGNHGAGGLNAAGDLTLNAVELTSGAGFQTSINAGGTLTIGAPASLRAGTKLPLNVGGDLELTAAAIQDSGAIALPSGIVRMTATSGDLNLADAASINVAGAVLQAVNRTAASPGGIVALNASGNLSLGAGTQISVAGNQNAPAGSLDLRSGGTATLAGTLGGAAATGGSGGRFSLDAGLLSGDLSPLALTLGKGGFDNLVEVRVHGGDLTLLDGASLAATHVSLSADAGAVDIAGTISAPSGAQRGVVELSGGTGVTLASTGQLHADAAGANGLGGKIELNTTCAACAITLNPGSVISAHGNGQMGELVLRAPALTSTNDVAINVGSQGIGADVTQAGQVIIDPLLVFQTSQATVNADLDAGVHAAADFLTNAAAPIAARLTGPNVSIQAAVELQDANPADKLTLQSYDLSQFSAPGGPGQVINLAVRSAGSLDINGTISDGFVAEPNTGLLALSSNASGTLSFVAGADLSAANPLSVLSGSTADLTLRTSTQRADGTPDGVGPSVVRTGTGDINLVAAKDVTFQAGTAAYTGGRTPANVIGPLEIDGSAPSLQNFGVNGGSVVMNAGRDIVGSPVGSIANANNGNYSVSGWQLRQGNAQNPAQYGINFAAFDWNVGALGGGDVSVNAGRNVNDLSAATADARVAGSGDNSVSIDGLDHVYGAGGGLSIRATGDIGSAQVYVADGVGSLTAGGGLTTTRTVATNKLPVGSAIALGDADVSVWARQDVQIDAIYNPTFVPQLIGFTSPDTSGAYFSYGANAAVNLSSTAGAVTLELSTQNGTMGTLLGSKLVAASGASGLLVAPPNLSIQSLQGDVILTGAQTAFLYPSSTGQLSLFAGRDITSSGGLVMSDTLAAAFPTVADPGVQPSLARNVFNGLSPFQNVIHVGDANPALITAGRDITELTLSIPKAADIVAGRDLVNLQYSGQNDAQNDTTLIIAGRDLLDTSAQGNFPGIQLGGLGGLDVVTGRNLNLGARNGIITLGNLANANLPTSQGADLNVLVGYGQQGADYSGFLQKIVAPSAGYAAELIAYVDSLSGISNQSLPQAENEFAAFTNAQQGAFIDNVFFNELLLSGRAANSGTGVGFKQGYDAIDALFPNSRTGSAGTNPYAGDLTLTSSQIYTFSGGSISLIVPGGKIDVGLANPPAGIAFKSASQLGIVAQGAGDVRIYSKGDVNVNQSRIFTLGGGNILIWSNEGSIDAGNGSKSSLSVPPPIVLIAADGTIQLDFAGSLASGSGIRTIQTGTDVPAGNVDLDAPVGTVNAGDAGIGSAGNINIAAQHVIGVDNINFGGSAAGVPSDLSGLGASLSGVSSVAAGTTSSATSSVEESKETKDVAPLADTALSWLDVFVTGLGEENCKQDDIECLKRQKTAKP